MLNFLKALFEPLFTAQSFYAIAKDKFRFLSEEYGYKIVDSTGNEGVGYTVTYAGNTRAITICFEVLGYQLYIILSSYENGKRTSLYGDCQMMECLDTLLEVKSPGITQTLPTYKSGVSVSRNVEIMLEATAECLKKYGGEFLTGDEHIIHLMKEFRVGK